ncbi:MAG: phage tail protein [Clostridiaceae bacterium]
MAIASFASKTFNASLKKVYTFNSFTRSGSLNIEEQEVEGQKPSSYIKGSSLEDLSLAIPLIAQNTINISTEIDSWMSIKDSKTPYPFILGNKMVGKNKFLLTNVSVSEATLNSKGEYLKATIQLQFKEFVRYGSKKDDAGTSSDSKSSKKRSNSNATNAVEQGAE